MSLFDNVFVKETVFYANFLYNSKITWELSSLSPEELALMSENF